MGKDKENSFESNFQKLENLFNTRSANQFTPTCPLAFLRI